MQRTIPSNRRTPGVAAATVLALLIGLGITLPSRSAAQTPTATPTPGGDCCSVHGGPSCDNGACNDCVCAGATPAVTPDATCCDPAGTGWDTVCVGDAMRCGDVCACNPTPGPTPTPGSCCDPQEGPGCNDSGCQACVCNKDPHCCGVGFSCTADQLCWDASCVIDAQTDPCASSCACTTPTPAPAPTPGGDCCADHLGPSCDDATCTSCVCGIDPACCSANTGWDTDCASEASIECNDSCPACPGTGDCCTTHDGPGCNDTVCKQCVCNGAANDSVCCDQSNGWDGNCVLDVTNACLLSCACVPKGACCTAHGGPGCDDASCTSCVCGIDPSCCSADTGWDTDCASEASIECSDSCPACPGTGDCCTAHGGPGCDDTTCKQCVCNGAASDPVCCDQSNGWDGDCVLDVTNTCNTSCACVPKGPCCTAHGGAACDDASCTSCVCGIDPSCCSADTGWDMDCASEASIECSASCPACPGTGDCCTMHDGPGCDDTTCKQCVCDGAANDPACCDQTNGWDGNCVLDVTGTCATSCACVAKGSCCAPHADPSCDTAACASCVCGIDPPCCTTATGWDANCVADTAAAECANSCLCNGPPCPGDCGGDGQVAINELIVCVNIALGSADLASCTAIDTNGNGTVEITELIQAVNAALNGCPQS